MCIESGRATCQHKLHFKKLVFSRRSSHVSRRDYTYKSAFRPSSDKGHVFSCCDKVRACVCFLGNVRNPRLRFLSLESVFLRILGFCFKFEACFTNSTSPNNNGRACSEELRNLLYSCDSYKNVLRCKHNCSYIHNYERGVKHFVLSTVIVHMEQSDCSIVVWMPPSEVDHANTSWAGVAVSDAVEAKE